MPSVSCHCGAKYKIPETSLGKKAKCKKCDSVFTLQLEDDGVIPIAAQEDDDFRGTFAAEAAEAAIQLPSNVGPRMVAPSTGAIETIARGKTLTERKATGTYWDNLLWTILFPADPTNLVILLLLFMCLAGLNLLLWIPFISRLKFCFLILLYGWYCGYRFRVVEGAAAGDSQLPDMSASIDWLDDALYPFLQWVGSWMLVVTPAVLQLVFADGITDPFEVYGLWVAAFHNPSEVWNASPVAAVLIYVGLFCWPMIVLTISLGGFGSLARIDLMLLSLLRSFPIYVFTVCILALATIAESFASGRIYGKMLSGPNAMTGLSGWGLFADLLVIGVSVYFTIVSLRSIGLYYHHFKDKFAWNWG